MYEFLGICMNKCTSQEMLSVSFSASFSHKFMWVAFCFPTKKYFGKERSQSFPIMAKLGLHGEPSKIVKIVLNTQSAKLKEVERKLVIKCPEQVIYSCISMPGRTRDMSFPLCYRSQLQNQTALLVPATLLPSIPFKLFITQWLMVLASMAERAALWSQPAPERLCKSYNGKEPPLCLSTHGKCHRRGSCIPLSLSYLLLHALLSLSCLFFFFTSPWTKPFSIFWLFC